jgi:hypothetical protein
MRACMRGRERDLKGSFTDPRPVNDIHPIRRSPIPRSIQSVLTNGRSRLSVSSIFRGGERRCALARRGAGTASVPDWTLDAADGARRNRDVHATAPRTRLLAHTKAWMGMNSSFCCTLVSCTLLGGSTVDPSKQGSDRTHGFRAVPLYACRAVPLGGCE